MNEQLFELLANRLDTTGLSPKAETLLLTAFLGATDDPVLDGWDAHQQVFEVLEQHVV